MNPNNQQPVSIGPNPFLNNTNQQPQVPNQMPNNVNQPIPTQQQNVGQTQNTPAFGQTLRSDLPPLPAPTPAQTPSPMVQTNVPFKERNPKENNKMFYGIIIVFVIIMLIAGYYLISVM